MRRKDFLQKTLFAATGIGIMPLENLANTSVAKKKPSFSFAFISDMHVKPTIVAEEGTRKALQKINANPNIQFIINGGDTIMDGLKMNKEKTAEQWNLWNKIILEENKLPIYNCIGNHDVWGWQLKDETVKTDALYGKQWAIQQHKIENRFYSFTKDNYTFIVLDSTQENNGGYIAKIDEEQFIWLENTLQTIPSTQQICIVSHIPIVSFCSALFYDTNEANGDWKISRALLHVDSRRLIQLFKKYNNIKACLSGHIHLQDEVKYLGVKYYCNGAISGNWWNGSFKDFAPAYAVFNFYKDGSIEREMVEY